MQYDYPHSGPVTIQLFQQVLPPPEIEAGYVLKEPQVETFRAAGSHIRSPAAPVPEDTLGNSPEALGGRGIQKNHRICPSGADVQRTSVIAIHDPDRPLDQFRYGVFPILFIGFPPVGQPVVLVQVYHPPDQSAPPAASRKSTSRLRNIR